MKTTKILSIAALALMMTACSNDDNDLTAPQPNPQSKGIPFTATISIGQSAATRALTEDAVNNKLMATWTAGEKVALIHNDVIDEMTVSSVVNGTATITGTITGNPANNDAVTIIYPSSAVDPTTKDIKANLLAAQDGTLTGTAGTSIAEKYDVRKGVGTLEVGTTASLYGNVSLSNQFAIFKLTLGSAIDATHPLYIKNNTDAVIITVTPTATTTTVYVAMPAGASTTYKFYAETADNRIVKSGAATIVAGQYYQTTLAVRYPLAMASATADDLGSLLASDGNIYATGAVATAAGTTAIGVIAYIGTDNFTENGTVVGSSAFVGHGLVLCLKNAASSVSWSTEQVSKFAGQDVDDVNDLKRTDNVSGYTNTATLTADGATADKYPAAKAAKNYTALPVPTTGTTGWFLPSAQQWVKMIEGLGALNESVITWNTSFDNSHTAAEKWETALAKAGAGNYDSMTSLQQWYASSSEYSYTRAVCLSVGASGGLAVLGLKFTDVGKTFSNSFAQVRPVLAF